MDPSKAKPANFTRLCKLLVDKGGEALRNLLNKKHPPSTLAAVLNTNKVILRKAINSSQRDLLFPPSGAAPDSSNFDITLLIILLRNICGLSPPTTKGRNKMPRAGDTSESADIERIRLFRNNNYAHITETQLDDAKFEQLWKEISQPLVRLGVRQQDIDEIKVAPHEEWEPKSHLRDKLPMFTGREDEIKKIITLLNDEKKALVSLRGGPGFGKTSIAIEVSHKLSEDHKIPVVFSQLTTATNEDEMIRQLCLDVHVSYEDDPKQSLMQRLGNIKNKVIFVMDDIDNLLKDRDTFYRFVHLLRQNSNQQCQIVTTSRKRFEIPNLSVEVPVGVMNDKACTELLKKHCPKTDEIFLQELAEHCGNIPLAMCIAVSRVDHFKDPAKLLQCLKKKPMKTLKHSDSDQCVHRAFEMSFKECSDEKQETLVRLSVFEGSFDQEAAEAVLEKDEQDTIDILNELVSLSLTMKEPTQHRYSIHLLIKSFLKDKQESGNEQSKTKAERARAEAMCAEVLMVEYYLELGHQLTMKSYSKDGYKDNREALKREASNIQNVLKICCQQEHPTSSDISDCLARSNIYTISARLFSIFVRTITPAPTVDDFLQRCANLAKDKEQYAVKINFECLLVAEERYESIGNDDFTSLTTQMEEIKNEFDTRYEELKNDKSLCAHYYYQYGRYLWRKSRNHDGKEELDLQIQAREQLKKSLELRKTITKTPVTKADIIFSLLQLGKICKAISSTEHHLRKRNESQTSLTQAKEYYKEAIQLSQDTLGEHELTSSCYKHSGDLFLKTKEFELAEKEYTTAKDMREKLELDASEKYVFILKNLGGCLLECKRGGKAIEVLEEAFGIAEKLPKSAKLENVWWIRAYTSLAIAYNLVQKNDKAVCYAKKVMELTGKKEKIISYHQKKKLLEILGDNKS